MRHGPRRGGLWRDVLLLPLLLPCAAVPALAQHTQHPQQTARKADGFLPGLGNHTYRITTSKPTTQRYFDQGLALAYAFNHAEARRSFEEGARLDPACAMCYWGVAYVL